MSPTPRRGIPIKLITPEEVSDKPGNTFVISGEIDEAKREAIQGYLRAWSKAMYVAAMQEFGVIDELIANEDFLNPSFIEPANDWERSEVEADVAAWRQENGI